MKRLALGYLVLMLSLTACDADVTYVVELGIPDAPRALAVTYYAGSVQVTWELGPEWDGEAFRVYSRRVTDASWFFIAEVTSCIDNFCLYEDLNIVNGETYEYIVSAVSDGGVETDSDVVVEVFVPPYTTPPIPDGPRVVGLDNANYLTWGIASQVSDGFSHYRVYLDDGSSSFLLGETDSEGFLDLLAANGRTYTYFVLAVDLNGHESDGSPLASGTPRPDFTGEWLYDFADVPASSGFQFSEDENVLPIVDGLDPLRHFRLESDVNGWWLVPGPNAAVYPTGFATSALKCGVAADAGCVDLQVAPTGGYVVQAMNVITQESYVLRVIGNDGQTHYGMIRVDLLGFDQNNDALMIFDWAYQLQANNPELTQSRGG
ncbi:MAG: hypothetical protein OSA81_09250 [Longimicrobiales bacterium]|nr:hypothetical protein [Longimicrobiales bacterium]